MSNGIFDIDFEIKLKLWEMMEGMLYNWNRNSENHIFNNTTKSTTNGTTCIGSAVMRQTQLLKTCENQHCFHRKITCKYKLIFNEFS